MLLTSQAATVTITVRPSVPGTLTHEARVSGEVVDPNGANNTAGATIMIESALRYLPSVLRHHPPIPLAPVLNPIANSDGDGDYTVTWQAVVFGTSYVLQEATNPQFTGAVTVFNGPGTSWSTVSRLVGTYYYRVKAVSATAESGWSNVQAVAVLRHFDGYWQGTTSQGRPVTFSIYNNNLNTLSFGYVYNPVSCPNSIGTQIYTGRLVPISGNAFAISVQASQYEYDFSGTFTSSSTASGTFTRTSYSLDPYCYGTVSGTWTASKQSLKTAAEK
jgi:hypothetical protein